MNSLAYTLFGGFAMALADSVPGVSGGTVAFLLGFYDTFVGPTTLKVPQHAMTLADFDALWFAAGAALMLVLSFLKSRLARQRENGAAGGSFSDGVDKKKLLR